MCRLTSGNSFRRMLRLFGKVSPVGLMRRRVSSSLALLLVSPPPSASLRIAGSSESGTCRITGFSHDGERGSRVFESRSMEISGCDARCIVESGKRRVALVENRVPGRCDDWLCVEGARRADVAMLGFELDRDMPCTDVGFASLSGTGMEPRDRERLYEFRARSAGGYTACCEDKLSRRWSQLL
jgi:hypothetical protein